MEIALPAEPDAFLDDADVIEANRRDDYMPYWAYLWPSATEMANWLPRCETPRGTRVLELGSGVGLVGLAGLALGWEVTFSDYDERALTLCRHNALRNGFAEPQTLKLDWRQPIDHRYPAIIGCEVTYDAAAHRPLLETIDALLSSEGTCRLGDPGRSQGPHFLQAASEHGFSLTIRDEAGRRHPEPLRGRFQVFELRRTNDAARRMVSR